MKKHYYLYIDDSGSRFPDKKPEKRNDGMDHFALGGILIEEGNKKKLEEEYKKFCAKWGITYPLHSTKIRGTREGFSWLEEDQKQKEVFMVELSDLLTSIPVIGFAAVIHRPGYNKRYKDMYGEKQWWMCKTTYSILIERVTRYVMNHNGTLEIRYEGVGPKEDKAIVQYAKDLKATGSPFNSDTSVKYTALTSEDYKNIILGEPRQRTKANLFIQIADLYLYPMAKRRYDSSYGAWKILFENKKVIDAILPNEEWQEKGIKYSCFEEFESKNPE